MVGCRSHKNVHRPLLTSWVHATDGNGFSSYDCLNRCWDTSPVQSVMQSVTLQHDQQSGRRPLACVPAATECRPPS
jgi:hypothetical protein